MAVGRTDGGPCRRRAGGTDGWLVTVSIIGSVLRSERVGTGATDGLSERRRHTRGWDLLTGTTDATSTTATIGRAFRGQGLRPRVHVVDALHPERHLPVPCVNRLVEPLEGPIGLAKADVREGERVTPGSGVSSAGPTRLTPRVVACTREERNSCGGPPNRAATVFAGGGYGPVEAIGWRSATPPPFCAEHTNTLENAPTVRKLGPLGNSIQPSLVQRWNKRLISEGFWRRRPD